jgi:hypothetical protein
MAASLRTGINLGSFATRAVHLKIQPQPKTIADSRDILRFLQKYGDVVMFKSLRVSTNPLP